MASEFQLPPSDASFGRSTPIVPSSPGTPQLHSRGSSPSAAPPGSALADDPKPDKLAFIAVAFSHKLPIINLELPTGLPPLPGHSSNLKRSYSLGVGKSSFLELHQLKDDEFQALRRQRPDFPGDRLVALKGSTKRTATVDTLHSFKQELRVLCHMKLQHHENIANALFIGFDASFSPMIGLELAEFGSLDDVLSSRALDAHSPRLAFSLALDVANGMAALHACGIAHGDLKPGNILVYRNKSPHRTAVAKMADFGDSVFVQDMVGGEWQPLGGTHSWRAPECYDDEIYDPYKADVYSFGLCILAVLFRGDRTTRGPPGACFLDRVALGEIGERQERVTRWKKDTGIGVVRRACHWVGQYASEEDLTFIGKAMASACLHRSPGRRIDAPSILAFLGGSVLDSNSQSRDRATLQATMAHTRQLNELVAAPFEAPDDTIAWDLYLFSPTDARFKDLDPKFKRLVFDQLTNVASILSSSPPLNVNQAFLENDFTFQELQAAFLQSIKPPTSGELGIGHFDRACQAASHLIVCLMNGWGHPSWHDMPYVISMLLERLVLAARHGDWLSALFCSLLDGQERAAIEERYSAPTRPWAAWATLKGCQTAARKLHVTDPELHHKVLSMACHRHGPLHNRDDPTTFVENLVHLQTQRGHANLGGLTERWHSFLDLAIYNGNLPLIRELIEDQHCNINQRTLCLTDTDVMASEGGETPVMLAAKTRNLDIFQYFLEKDADLSLTSDYGCNVLHAITWFSDDVATDLLPGLVSRGASLSAVARRYYPRGVYNPLTRVEIKGSPLQWAVTIGHMSLTRSLIELHVQREEKVPDLDEMLAQAASRFHAVCLAFLVEHFPQLHSSHAPIPTETLDVLLGHSLSNPLQFHKITVHGMQSAEAQIKTVKILLENGACPLRHADVPVMYWPRWSGSSRNALHNSIVYGSAEALEVLITHLRANGRDIRRTLKDPSLYGGRDAIQRSIYCNRQGVFDYLITLADQDLLDLDFTSERGMTALHAACFQADNAHYITALLEPGCRPYARSSDGSVPFINAMRARNLDGARVMAESPFCDGRRLFREPNRQGHTLVDIVITMALTNYRNHIGEREIRFLRSIGACVFGDGSVTGHTVLHALAKTWPSAREDHREFDGWLLA